MWNWLNKLLRRPGAAALSADPRLLALTVVDPETGHHAVWTAFVFEDGPYAVQTLHPPCSAVGGWIEKGSVEHAKLVTTARAGKWPYDYSNLLSDRVTPYERALRLNALPWAWRTAAEDAFLLRYADNEKAATVHAAAVGASMLECEKQATVAVTAAGNYAAERAAVRSTHSAVSHYARLKPTTRRLNAAQPPRCYSLRPRGTI
jgi:hypothetical protein